MCELRELVLLLWDGVLAGCDAFWREFDLRGRLAFWHDSVRAGRQYYE